MINEFKAMRWPVRLLASVVMLTCASAAATAQQCTAEQFGDAVDQAGAGLRDITHASQPKFDQRLKALKAKYNWTDGEAAEKALELLSDERTATFDRTANDLLARVDVLGKLPQNTVPECSRLQELEAASLELQAVVKAKASYLLARADTLLSAAPQVAATPPATSAAPTVTPPQTPAPAAATEKPPAPITASPQPKAPPPAVALVKPPPPAPATTPVKPTQPAPAPKQQPLWSTTTTVDASATPPPPPLPPIDAQPTRQPNDFTVAEIVRASTGFFGKVSSGLGSVVEHAFSSVGRPTGYILGQEGGGAFLAGLRYGSGTLYLRDGSTMPVHWHGPSIGLDIGAQGTKVMFLVYRMTSADTLWPTFTSVEGSAFLAGGIGMTLMTNGNAQLAPIRSGIGLRFGASVGYVRFTRKPTWNPF